MNTQRNTLNFGLLLSFCLMLLLIKPIFVACFFLPAFVPFGFYFQGYLLFSAKAAVFIPI
jgi:hypothetical protein